MTLRYVVLDYDGTCTNVPAVQEAFLAEYRRLFAEELPAADASWDAAVLGVRTGSPEAAWSLLNDGSAPAAADPYILAYEVEQRVLKAAGAHIPPDRDTFYRRAYDAPGCNPPWRDEAAEVLRGLVAAGVKVWFVSNSAETHILAQLGTLLQDDPETRRRVNVRGGATKYRIGDLGPGAPTSPAQRASFDALPRAVAAPPLRREVLLRRSTYFELLAGIWGDDPTAPGDTLVCGDIWELDLAMPAALGCQVHLVTRAAPFGTYDYERLAAAGLGRRGGMSADLRGVLARVVEGASLGDERLTI